MRDKIERLLESVENSDRLSDTELDELLEDSEAKAIHDVISRTAYALTETPEPNINKEWGHFLKEHYSPKHKNLKHVITYFISRNAAAVLIFAIVSFTVIAATISVKIIITGTDKRDNYETEITQTVPADTISKRDSINTDTKQSVLSQTHVFKNKSLENIISAIAGYYDATVIFNVDSTKDLRLYFNWDKSLPLEDVIAQLNSFERINITLNGKTIIVD